MALYTCLVEQDKDALFLYVVIDSLLTADSKLKGPSAPNSSELFMVSVKTTGFPSSKYVPRKKRPSYGVGSTILFAIE